MSDEREPIITIAKDHLAKLATQILCAIIGSHSPVPLQNMEQLVKEAIKAAKTIQKEA